MFKVSLNIITLLLVGCGCISSVETEAWELEKKNLRSLQTDKSHHESKCIMQKIFEDYKTNPYRNYRIEDLSHVKTLRDNETGDLYYVMQIEGLDDLDLVYKLSQKNKVLTNFLYSPYNQ